MALVLWVLGCSEKEINLLYQGPDENVYSNGYRSAFSEGFSNVVLGFESDFEEDSILTMTLTTMCGASAEFTKGWYAGQDYGSDFLRKIQDYDTSARIKRLFLRNMKDEIRAHQVVRK